MKRTTVVFCSLLLFSQLAACTSPEEKAAQYIESADSLLAEKNYTKAEIEYKNALQVNQNLPDAWYGLAKIHESKQQWREAYATLSKIREISPTHVNGRVMLGQILLASNQIDQALQDAKEILEMAPDQAQAHSLMAAVQFRLNNLEEAAAEVERALAIDNDNPEAILVRARVLMAEKKYADSQAVLDEAIKLNPRNVSLYLMKIQAYHELKDKAAIEAVYKALIVEFPDNLSFRHLLARSFLEAGKIDMAEAELEQIVKLNPDNIDEKIRLAAFKRQYRSIDVAIALLQQYIRQDKSQYRLRFGLGDIYEKNQMLDDAAQVYQEIIADDDLKANGLEARNKLALLNLRAGKIDEAKARVQEVLSHDKNNENALLLQAGFKINDRNYDDAIIDLRTVLRDNPDSIKALGLLGQAYNAKGSRKLAQESYTKAFQLKPSAPAVANQLARNLLIQKEPQQANNVLEQSISEGNSSLDAIKLLTEIKIRLGEWDQAERMAQQLKKVEGQEALSEQMMGVIFQSREQDDESIKSFKRAHELAPESAQPVVALVRTYVSNKEYDEARRFLNSVLKENDKNVTAYLLLGQLSILENNLGDAAGQFEKLIASNPGLDVGYRNLAAVYMRQNKWDQVERVMLNGLKAIPESVTLNISLASAYERQRAFDKAIALYESLLEKSPNLIIARNNLASLLTDHRSDQESHDRARQMSAEFKDSSVPQFRDTYAWAAIRSGINLEEAVIILKDVVKTNEKIGVYHYHLGEAYRKKGDRDNAVAYLEKAVSLERPDSDIADKAKQALKQIN